MAENVQDLVVRLSFEHGDTRSQIAAIRNEIRLLDTGFQAAAAGASGFSGTLNDTAARSDLLAQKIQLQQMAIDKYQQAIDRANQKLQQAQARQQDYTGKLEQARARHSELAQQIDQLRAAMDACDTSTEEGAQAHAEMAQQLQALEAEYQQCEAGIAQWERGIQRANTQMAAADRQVQQYTIAQNQARTSMAQMQGELDRLNSGAEQHRQRLQEAAEAMNQYAESARNAGQWQTQVGKELTKGSTAIVGAGVAAAGAAIGWESSMAGVSKTVSGTAEQLAGIEAGLLEMSRTKPIDSAQLAEIAANAGQLGIATDNVLGFTAVMADLANATNLSAEEGAAAFAQYANVTGMAQTDFDRLGSVVVDLGNNMATTEKDIVAMATNLASAGHQVGMTDAQIMGMAAGLSSLGLEAQAGGTAFSKLFVGMQVAVETGSDKLEQFAQVAGMTGEQFAQAFRDDASSAITAFIQGLSSGSQSAIVMLDDMGITETRMRDALLRASNASDLFSGAIQRANSAWASNTALQTEAGTRYATTASQITMVGNQAKAVAISFGQELLPSIQKGIDWVSKLIERFAALDSGQKQSLLTWGAYAAAVGPTVMAIGKANTAIGNIVGGVGKMTAAMAEAGGGLTGVLSAVGGLLGPAGIAALAAGAAVAAYHFFDWATGARAAREASEELRGMAEEWRSTQAQTIYDTGNGDALRIFGLSAEDFRTGSEAVTAAAGDWLQNLIDVWTDGEGETDEIVQRFVDGFTGASDDIRQGIEQQRTLLESHGALSPELQAQYESDLAQLDAWDAEIEALLEKRKNGYLTPEEQAHLGEIIEARQQLEIKYDVVEGDGYQQILTGMQAALERARAAGERDDSVWGDALNALAQGREAYNAALNESYDAEYAQIQLIQDEAARQAALNDLNERYTEKRIEGQKAYEQAARDALTGAWESQDDVYTDQMGKISELLAAINNGADTVEIKDLMGGLDKGQLAGMLAMIEQMKDAGFSEEDFKGLGIDVTSLEGQIQAIRDLTAGVEGLEGVNQIFGSILPEEVSRVLVGLDLTQAASDWAEFAAGGSLSPIQATLQPEAIDAADVIVNGTIKADGTLGTITGEDGKVYKVTGATVKADGTLETVTAENGVTYTVTDADVDVDGNLRTVTGEDGKTYTVDGVRAKVDGDLGTVTGADGKTYTVTGVKLNVNGQVQSLTLGNGRQITVGPVSVTGRVMLSALDRTAITAWETANSGVTLNGPAAKVGVKLGPTWATDLQTAMNTGLLQVYGADGMQIPVTPEVVQQITAQDVAMVDEDGTIHVILTPEIGTPEGVEAAGDKMTAGSGDGTIWDGLFDSKSEKLSRFGEMTGELEQLRAAYDALMAGGTPEGPFANWDLASVSTAIGETQTQMQQLVDTLTEEDLGDIGSYAENLMAALNSGELDAGTAEQYRAELEGILTLLETADTTSSGVNIAEGIAAGMTSYGFGGDAGTLAASVIGAINGALGAHSPATRLIPTGMDVAEGIASGMEQFNYAGAGASIAGRIAGSFASLPGRGRTIGANFGQGLYNGLRSKMSSALALARAYARQIEQQFRSAWQVHSPSKVAENLTQMFGAGLEEGMKDWPLVSDRLLQGDLEKLYAGARRAQGGTGEGQTTVGSQNTDQSINLNIDSLSVRDDRDIRQLAREIAQLRRRHASGQGVSTRGL